MILALAFFFKFNRVLSLRNWDLLCLFIMAPSLLLIQEGHDRRMEARQINAMAANLQIVPGTSGLPLMTAGVLELPARWKEQRARELLWWGYATLLIGTSYWLLRCLGDLSLVRRPVLPPNLNVAGLAWFAVAVYFLLGAVAAKRPPPEPGTATIGQTSTVLKEAQARAEELVLQTGNETNRDVIRWRVERMLAGACHFLVLVALVLVGHWHFGDIALGMAAASGYLVLPYLSFYMTQIHHVLPAALLTWAIVGYRRPGLAGALVGVAAGGFGFPVVAAPVWASFYRGGRGLGRFLIAFAIAAGCSLAMAALVLWLNDAFKLKIPTTFGAPQFSQWRMPNAEGFWTGVHWAYRIPVFFAASAFVIFTAFWPTPKNLAHVIALTAVQILAVQLWYADRGGVYVLWYLPILLLMVFRPSLHDKYPPLRNGTVSETMPASTGSSWALIRPPTMGV